MNFFRQLPLNFRSILLLTMLLVAVPRIVWAYNPPEDTAGPLHVRIEGPAEVKAVDQPVPIAVILDNRGDRPLAGTVKLGVIDRWRAEPASLPFQVAAHKTTRCAFHIVAGAGTYNAHYPVHAVVAFRDQKRRFTAHPILVLETKLEVHPPARSTVPWEPIKLEKDSALALWQVPVRRAIVQVFGEQPVAMPTGMFGTESRSHANVAIHEQSLGGSTRHVVAMHPPWFGGHVGTVFVEFPLTLPAGQPVTLEFANAMNPGGQSDGVTFRVRVAAWNAPAGTLGTIAFERHTNAKTWQDAKVDLSAYAGRTIRLQLESHPGPRNNTGWDMSFWAEPTLTAGHPPAAAAFPPNNNDDARLLGHTHSAGKDYDVRLWLGRRGLLDAVLGFQQGERTLYCQGFQVTVDGVRLDDVRSPVRLARTVRETVDGGLQVRHRFVSVHGPFDLVGWIGVRNNVLQVRFRIQHAPPPKPWFDLHVEDVAVGHWSRNVERVFAGVGNVVTKPRAFRLSFDGHRLATSMVGYDFGAGMSVIEACDVPPSYLDVRPDRHHISLHAAGDQLRTLIPTTDVWEGVKQWRQVNGLRAAAGVSRVAGRFVFDLWGGNYRASTEELQRAFRYGLTDAMVVWHNWQRWGYDYRLPEIYPPNPGYGTTDELRNLIQTCRRSGVLCALHDNYIDFYPDAEGFSYDNAIAFHADGTPVLAWLNKGRQARSYRYRADRIEPFLRHNLQRIHTNLGPSAYFIDVWSSAKPYDYWTADGKYYSAVYTRDTWRRLFAWIRNELGDDAPQISESGHDQLIGWLDGAQTNHLRVGPPLPGAQGWAVWNWKCADAERIPWYDAAHHDRFILHGAGYESRYVAGLNTRLHGMYSDDYIATEVLTGHPAMVSRPFGRDVVRKYWLLHDLMRALALRTIDSVRFVDGDIHRQHVCWSGGGDIWVNRGKSDWTVAGVTLPPYGFLARIATAQGKIDVSIQRRDGLIVELARAPRQIYANGRELANPPLPIRLTVGGVRYLGQRKCELDLVWQADVAIPAGWTPFLHFRDTAGDIAFQAVRPAGALQRTKPGKFSTKRTCTIPADLKPGQTFELCYGFYNRQTGARLTLAGPDVGDRRIRLGSIRLEGTGSQLSGVTWLVCQPREDPFVQRHNPDKRAVDFGLLATSGGCRLTAERQQLVVTPLPGRRAQPFSVAINWARLPWPCLDPKQVEARADDGHVIALRPVRRQGDVIQVDCAPGVFAYRLVP